MKITLRANFVDVIHTRFTVFVNGANCGELRMRNEEAVAFYLIVQNGCHPKFDQFLGQGKWAHDKEKEENK